MSVSSDEPGIQPFNVGIEEGDLQRLLDAPEGTDKEVGSDQADAPDLEASDASLVPVHGPGLDQTSVVVLLWTSTIRGLDGRPQTSSGRGSCVGFSSAPM